MRYGVFVVWITTPWMFSKYKFIVDFSMNFIFLYRGKVSSKICARAAANCEFDSDCADSGGGSGSNNPTHTEEGKQWPCSELAVYCYPATQAVESRDVHGQWQVP